MLFPSSVRSLLLAASLLFAMLGICRGHNLDQRNTQISLDQPSLDVIAARAANNLPLMVQGDVIGFILKSTPGPGTKTGAGGYMTFFIPPGTQVQRTQYVQPDGTGGYVPRNMKPAAPLPIGSGSIGTAVTNALKGLTLGPNAAGRTAAAVNSSGVHNGTIAGVYNDTGIFYSTDPDTAWNTYVLTGGYDGNVMTNDSALTNNSGERFVPGTKWDAEQLIGFGTKQPAAPVIDPNGRGSTPWGMGSAVAGPQSGYAWCFDRDYWRANPSDPSRMKNAVVMGPWKRIRYAGSTISKDDPGSTSNVNGHTYEDASSLGVVVSPASPLPPTLSLTDSTSPKAIRIAYGELSLGHSEYARVELKVLASQGQPGSPFDASGSFTVRSEAFGGDAGGDSNGRDHLWRYYDADVLELSTQAMLQKRFVNTPVSKGSASYFDLVVVNTGLSAMTNVVITDPMPPGLVYTAASVTPSSTSPLTWNLGTVPAQGYAFIRVHFTPSKTGTFFNTATMNSSAGQRQATDSLDVVSIVPDDPPPTPMRVGNLIFRDLNFNGLADPGEGVNGVTVQLFDGEADPAVTPPLASTVTAGGGYYHFTGVMPGHYVVHVPASMFNGSAPLAGLSSLPGKNTADDDAGEDGVDAPQSWVTGVTSREFMLSNDMAPTNSTTETGLGSTVDDADDNNGDLTIDLGFFQAVAVGNLVFLDSNGNGHADGGEGLDGITVQLYASDQTPGVDVPLDTSITEGGGRYLFSGLEAGSYRVHIPADMFTSDTPLHTIISVAQGVAGDDDVGEDGINDDDIFYNGISSGIVTLAPGLAPTGQNGETGVGSDGDDAFDAAIDLTVDFGFANPLGVGNFVFNDANSNGRYDSGEGVSGVTLDLYQSGATPGVDLPIASQTTTIGGHYLFDYLMAGAYFIHVPPSEFLPGGPLAGKISVPGAGFLSADDNVDENGVDDFSPHIFGIRSGVFTLSNDSEPTSASLETGYFSAEDARDDNNYDLTIDLGFRSPNPGALAVGNTVFLDSSANGTFDEGEGINGVTVKLFASNANPITATPLATTTTSGDGSYVFTNLSAGSYFIQIPPAMFANGAPMHRMLSLHGQGTDNEIDDDADENGDDPIAPAGTGVRSTVFTLAVDAEPTGFVSEFGHDSIIDDIDDDNGDLTIDFGFYRPVGVGNLIWADLDLDGSFDTGEGRDGVSVELYGEFDFPGFDLPLATTTTSGGGRYLFDNLEPGGYIVHIPSSQFSGAAPLAAFAPWSGQGADDGTDDDFDENGSDPSSAWAEGVSSLAIILSSGLEPTDAISETGQAHVSDNAADSDTDLTIDFAFRPIAPPLFANWQVQYPLGGQNGHSQDPEGDGVSNLAEYAFALTPHSGLHQRCPFEIVTNPVTDKLDLVVRRSSASQDVVFVVEALSDLTGSPGAWAVLPAAPEPGLVDDEGIETLYYRDVEQYAALSGGKGFVRLRIDLDANRDNIPEATARTEVWGFARRTISTQMQTFSNPFLLCPVFNGVIDSVSSSTLDVAGSLGAGDSLVASMTPADSYYIEIISGDNEGHRFEVDEMASTASTLAIDTSATAYNTLASPPASLAGDRLVLRRHVQLGDLLPPVRFRATNSQNSADRILFFSGSSFTSHWLFSNGGNPFWAFGAGLTNKNTRIMPPGEAIVLHPRVQPAALVALGVVRANKFACPLKVGTTLLGGGWPMDQSPASRSMNVATGFKGATSAASADRLQLWAGDATPGGSGYESHYLLRSGSIQRWVRLGDATLADEMNTPLLKSMCGAYHISVLGLPAYVIPRSWTP